VAFNKLSSKEKGQIKRLICNIQTLCHDIPHHSDMERFSRRQQLKAALLLLGADSKMIDLRLRVAALDIIRDWKPFKQIRLRKLINERKPK